MKPINIGDFVMASVKGKKEAGKGKIVLVLMFVESADDGSDAKQVRQGFSSYINFVNFPAFVDGVNNLREAEFPHVTEYRVLRDWPEDNKNIVSRVVVAKVNATTSEITNKQFLTVKEGETLFSRWKRKQEQAKLEYENYLKSQVSCEKTRQPADVEQQLGGTTKVKKHDSQKAKHVSTVTKSAA